MAAAAAADAAVPSAQLVGNAFVHQYYHVLRTSPQLVYRFYQDGSKLSRSDPHGIMASVTSMQAISEQILSPDYGGLAATIRTVDSQDSLGGGVIVLVTGCITGADGSGRDFSQTFFLAPQDNGYFVLNDIFRFLDDVREEDVGQQEVDHGLVNGGTDVVHPSEQDSPALEEEHVVHKEGSSVEEEVYDPLENGEAHPVKQEELLDEAINGAGSSLQETVVKPSLPASAVVVESSPPPAAVVSELSPAVTPEEAPKKTYASIVKVMRDSPAPLMVPTSYHTRPSSTNLERNAAPTPPVPSEIVAVGSTALESSNDQEPEVDGHSIYIRNIPMTATPLEVEDEFKRFGPIKPGGIQVRINKIQGFCFGFVEFEVATAVQSAIEASPVMMGGRSVYVEEKRAPTSRFSTRGRFAPGRGAGFRNDGVRGRGSFAGGGYGRGNFNNRTDFGRGGGRGGMSRGGGRSVTPRVSASA